MVDCVLCALTCPAGAPMRFDCRGRLKLVAISGLRAELTTILIMSAGANLSV